MINPSELAGIIAGDKPDAKPPSPKSEKQPIGYKPKITPSQSAFPVFVLCQPLFVDDGIKNNIWMNGQEAEIDKAEFMGQWYNLYKELASTSLIYLLPPRKGLQDQTYVNCAMYLPHIVGEDTIILSNFTAPGRAGEELIAKTFFKELGYKVVNCPYKFEGEPELKYVRDNIYLGGYGQRTEANALIWIEKQFGARIIRIEEQDPHLYHLDCTAFRIDPQNVIVCTSLIDKATVKEIEKVANVHSVSEKDSHAGITNSVRVEDIILNASSLRYMKKNDDKYDEEMHKNRRLEEICNYMGIEIIYVDVGESSKSGAALSCFCMHLNYRK